MKTKVRYHIAVLSLVFLFALTGGSCRGKNNRLTVQNEEDGGGRMASTVRMNDPHAGAQLLSGFYAMENGAWRWTAGKFSVLLRTPPEAAQRGGALTLAFTIPDIVIQKLNKVTITASINGMALKSAEFDAPGSYVFSTDVPASALTKDSVRVDFAVNRTLPPGVDKRELGIIAMSVGVMAR